MAASSAYTVHSNNNQLYHVFINHRGPDTKLTFARSLYVRLLSNRVSAFLDQEELQKGYSFPSQIENAIVTASVHVAILSPGYAESNWCLDELVRMLETKAPIIPVFYGVTPAEVRWTRGKNGKYAQALQKLEEKKTYDPQTQEKKPRYDSNTIENWRNALSEVADISGFELEARNIGEEVEVELVDKVVKRLSEMLRKPDLYVAKFPTGLDEKLKDFEDTVQLEQQRSGGPQILGIWGLGGTGKTTLAKEFFNRKNSDYHRSCFLYGIKDSAANGTLNSLQKELFRSLTSKDEPVSDVEVGKGMLIEPLKSSNALIVLDDVDDVNQVDALLPIQTHDLRSSSLILITSRDKHVLISSRVENSSIYKLTELNTQHSRELFCSYAFSKPDPTPGFESLVDKFLDSCNGLPLSLKVFGAHLYGRSIDDWKLELRSLLKILPSEIKERLKISYDALNKEEKQIFLDIACFFIGQNRDTVIRIWDGSGWNGRRGFQNLEKKSLVEVDSLNGIHMHDHLRDMGRDISEDSNLPRRLWHWTENVIDDLLQHSSGVTVRGLRMVLSEYHAEDVYSAIGLRRLQLVDTEDALLDPILRRVEFPKLLWLRWNECPSSSLPRSIPMEHLRVLQVSGSQLITLWQDESLAPLQLRELEIFAPLLNIPKSIGQLKYLERIVVDGNSSSGDVNVQMTKLPEEFCDLQSLKALVLRNCSEMMSLPNSFGDLSNLQHIDLARCSKLARVPKSFGKLTQLKYLALNGCNKLTLRSEALGKISTLEYIDLSNCEKIEILPQQVAHQKSLVTLKLEGTNLKELATAIGELGDLEVLEIGSPFLDRLPPLGNLRSLNVLTIRECQELKCLPPSLGDLRNLEVLTIEDCKELKCLPPSLGNLRNLKELTIRNCKELKCLPPSLGDLSNLKELTIWGSDELQCLPPSMGDLRNLKKLLISTCKELKCLPASLGRLTQLTELDVFECPLRELPFEKANEGEREPLPTFPCLRELVLENTKISEVTFAEGVCPNLEILHILECDDLVKVGTLPNTLQEAFFTRCSNLRNIKGHACLERLLINGCQKVETLSRMETFVSLKKLVVSCCMKQRSIRGLAQLRSLRSLLVLDCDRLEELEGLEHCMSLKELRISNCPKMQWGEGILEQVRQQVEDCDIKSPEEIREWMARHMQISRSSIPGFL